ncbi:hypothetical protein QBC32DRAFT_207488, partial [Pseudoneurospora amorphoporcata]
QSAICSHQEKCRTLVLLICWRYLTANFQLPKSKRWASTRSSGSKSSATNPVWHATCSESVVLHPRGPSTSDRMIGFVC